MRKWYSHPGKSDHLPYKTILAWQMGWSFKVRTIVFGRLTDLIVLTQTRKADVTQHIHLLLHAHSCTKFLTYGTKTMAPSILYPVIVVHNGHVLLHNNPRLTVTNTTRTHKSCYSFVELGIIPMFTIIIIIIIYKIYLAPYIICKVIALRRFTNVIKCKKF